MKLKVDDKFLGCIRFSMSSAALIFGLYGETDETVAAAFSGDPKEAALLSDDGVELRSFDLTGYQAARSLSANQAVLYAVAPSQQEEPSEEELAAQLAEQVREQRNELLEATDWTQLADSPLDGADMESVVLYRQALRDVPQQAGFPHEVVWPEMPQFFRE